MCRTRPASHTACHFWIGSSAQTSALPGSPHPWGQWTVRTLRPQAPSTHGARCRFRSSWCRLVQSACRVGPGWSGQGWVEEDGGTVSLPHAPSTVFESARPHNKTHAHHTHAELCGHAPSATHVQVKVDPALSDVKFATVELDARMTAGLAAKVANGGVPSSVNAESAVAPPVGTPPSPVRDRVAASVGWT